MLLFITVLYSEENLPLFHFYSTTDFMNCTHIEATDILQYVVLNSVIGYVCEVIISSLASEFASLYILCR